MPISSQYLRLSITNLCNLSCYFCHNEGQSRQKLNYILSQEDILFIIKQAQDIGFTKIKLTGGEPTFRDDIYKIIKSICSLNIKDFSIITNGVKLFEIVEELKHSGLPRLNVTLQTLNKEKFFLNVCRDTSKLDLILKGIDKAIEIGYHDIKLNFIYHSQESDVDFLEICKFAADRNLTIVLLPILLINPKPSDENINLDTIYNKLVDYGIVSEKLVFDTEGIERRLIKLKNNANILLRINELADIFPYQSCNNCNMKNKCREGIFPIRITADGYLLPCLAEGITRVSLKNAIIERDKKQLINIIQKFRTT